MFEQPTAPPKLPEDTQSASGSEYSEDSTLDDESESDDASSFVHGDLDVDDATPSDDGSPITDVVSNLRVDSNDDDQDTQTEDVPGIDEDPQATAGDDQNVQDTYEETYKDEDGDDGSQYEPEDGMCDDTIVDAMYSPAAVQDALDAEDAATAHIEPQPAGGEGPIPEGDVVSRMIADLMENPPTHWMPANPFQEKLYQLILFLHLQCLDKDFIHTVMSGMQRDSPIGAGAWRIFCKFDPGLLTQLILAGIPAETQTILGADNLTPDDLCRLPSARGASHWGVYAHVLQTREEEDGPTGLYIGSSIAVRGMGERIKIHKSHMRRGKTARRNHEFAKKHGTSGVFHEIVKYPQRRRHRPLARIAEGLMAMFFGTICPAKENAEGKFGFHTPAAQRLVDSARRTVPGLPMMDIVPLNGCPPLKQGVEVTHMFPRDEKCGEPGCEDAAAGYRFSGNPIARVCASHWALTRFDDPAWMARGSCSKCGTERVRPEKGFSAKARWKGNTPTTSVCPECCIVGENAKLGGCNHCGRTGLKCNGSGDNRRCKRCRRHVNAQVERGVPKDKTVEWPNYPDDWSENYRLGVNECVNPGCDKKPTPWNMGEGEERRCRKCHSHLDFQRNMGYTSDEIREWPDIPLELKKDVCRHPDCPGKPTIRYYGKGDNTRCRSCYAADARKRRAEEVAADKTQPGTCQNAACNKPLTDGVRFYGQGDARRCGKCYNFKFRSKLKLEWPGPQKHPGPGSVPSECRNPTCNVTFTAKHYGREENRRCRKCYTHVMKQVKAGVAKDQAHEWPEKAEE